MTTRPGFLARVRDSTTSPGRKRRRKRGSAAIFRAGDPSPERRGSGNFPGAISHENRTGSVTGDPGPRSPLPRSPRVGRASEIVPFRSAYPPEWVGSRGMTSGFGPVMTGYVIHRSQLLVPAIIPIKVKKPDFE